MPAPLRTPADRLRPFVQALCFALEAQTQSFVARLARPLMGLVLHRLIVHSHRLRRFLERIEAGRPFPRRRGVTRQSPRRHTPDPLPRTFNWLERLLPEIVPHRAQLSLLLETPEMAAGIAAAPVQMGRALRPLCRMLGLHPPTPIAPPPRRKPVRQSPPNPMPRGPHDPRRRTRLGFYEGAPPPLRSTARPRSA